MPVNLLATPAAELFPVPGVRWGIAEAGIRKAGRKDLSVLLLDEGSVDLLFNTRRVNYPTVGISIRKDVTYYCFLGYSLKRQVPGRIICI